MSAKSNYLENAVLDAYLSGGTPYVALFTSNPDEDGSGTELSGNGYARESATFGAASGGSASTTADIEFTASGANWGTITHVGIYDASTNGNLLWYGALASSKAIDDGETLVISAGDLTVTEA